MGVDEAGRGFLSRWSRRKAAGREAVALEPAVEASPVGESGLEAHAPLELPSIESLGADSDYTVFLARGVSCLVQAQALRVAWASDPTIAEFRGFAEYAWDFNAPGYGDLAPGDDAVAWLSQIVRSSARGVVGAAVDAVTAGGEPLALAEPIEPPLVVAPEPVAEITHEGVVAAVVPVAAPLEPEPAAPVRRRHGGAVPV